VEDAPHEPVLAEVLDVAERRVVVLDADRLAADERLDAVDVAAELIDSDSDWLADSDPESDSLGDADSLSEIDWDSLSEMISSGAPGPLDSLK